MYNVVGEGRKRFLREHVASWNFFPFQEGFVMYGPKLLFGEGCWPPPVPPPWKLFSAMHHDPIRTGEDWDDIATNDQGGKDGDY